MAKKKNRHNSKKRAAKTKKKAPQPKKRSKFTLVIFFAGGVLILVGAYFLYQGEKPAPRASEVAVLKKANFNLREDRPTLSPQRFSGNVRLAYEVAREIPEVLDQLYCYCRCRENFGHKNLLSCFVDTHAST